MPENEDVNQDARPQAPAAPEQQARPQAPPTEPGLPSQEELSSDKTMLLLANAMPWVISMLFHLGLFLVMFFLVFMVVKQPDSEEIIIPDAVMSDNPGGMVNPRQSQTKSKSQTRQKRKKFTRKTKISVDTGKTKTALKVFGGASAAATDDMGLRANTGTRSSFYGSGGNAHNIVYVVDRSGSMLSSFDDGVRPEVLKSIGRLKPRQAFHIILFASGAPLEKKPARLVAATLKNKRKAATFMANLPPVEDTSNPILALERAFAVLKGAKKPGKLIYLLTDGDFTGGGIGGRGNISNEKVIRAINQLNRDKKVLINTFLIETQAPEAVSVMTTIAKQNGGRYRFISVD